MDGDLSDNKDGEALLAESQSSHDVHHANDVLACLQQIKEDTAGHTDISSIRTTTVAHAAQNVRGIKTQPHAPIPKEVAWWANPPDKHGKRSI